MPCKRFECIHHTSYRTPDAPMCNYILDTGKPRGCPGGAGCKRYTTDKPKSPRKNSGYTPSFNETLAYKYYLEGKCDEEIGQLMHVPRTTINQWRRRRNYPSNIRREPWNKKLPPKEELMKCWEAGMLDREIAEKYGVRANAVFRFRKKYGLTANKMRLKEERERDGTG